MKIYLASRYSRAAQLRQCRTSLEVLGHTVTSRWINGGHEIAKEGSEEAARADRQRFAQEDWEDMLAADCVISFTEEPRKTTTRGGRHVEFGGALALGKRLIVVGFLENVFHCMPSVEFFEDWNAALGMLVEEKTRQRLGICCASEAEATTVRLTPREAEVLTLVFDGSFSQEVADNLRLSKRTVDFHIANIYRKLQVSNRIQAFREAKRLGLIPAGTGDEASGFDPRDIAILGGDPTP